MSKRSNRAEAQADEHADELYRQLQECIGYNAAALRATALFLNQHKSNREFMQAASAEMGRNARNWARAVDYFPGFFQTDAPQFTETQTADNVLKLFAFASLKKEQAHTLFREYGFNYPLHVIRARIAAARAEQRGEKRATLAEWCADQVEAGEKKDQGYILLNDLAARPEVAAVLARRAKAEAKP